MPSSLLTTHTQCYTLDGFDVHPRQQSKTRYGNMSDNSCMKGSVGKDYLGSSRTILAAKVDLIDNSEASQLSFGGLLISLYLVAACSIQDVRQTVGEKVECIRCLMPCKPGLVQTAWTACIASRVSSA